MHVNYLFVPGVRFSKSGYKVEVNVMNVLMITQKVDSKDDVLGFVHAWINELAGRVDNLYVLALSIGNHHLPVNVKLYSMGKDQCTGKIKKGIIFLRILLSLLRKRKIDVIFTHMCPIYAVLSAPWTRLFGVPLIMWHSHTRINLLARLAHGLSNQVLTASAESFITSAKVSVTGHGIDVNLFCPPKNKKQFKKPRVLTVGRVTSVKDYVTMIKAADRLINKMKQDVEFYIIGKACTLKDEGYIKSLRNMVDKLGLKERVVFVGQVPNDKTPEYYQKSSLFINMQSGGGMGKAVLEAMAVGLPCVLCTSAFNSQLDNFAKDVIYEEKNPGDMAEKILNVLNMEPKRLQKYSNLLRNIAEQNSVNTLMDKITKIFAKK